MTKKLRKDTAKLLSTHCPYHPDDIYIELRRYESVDLVIKGIEESLKFNLSLHDACNNLNKND